MALEFESYLISLGVRTMNRPIPRYANANTNELTSSPPPSIIPDIQTNMSYGSILKPIVTKRSFQLMHDREKL